MKSWFSTHRWRIIGWSLTAAIILNVTVAGFWIHAQVTEFDPLGSFTVQSVDLPLITNAGDGGQYPGLIIKDDIWPDVPVSGEKCSDETVPVEGSYLWQSVIPPGSYTAPFDGRSTRLQGCTRIAYRNRVPEQVRDRVRELAKQGITSSVWSMQGKEVPFRPGTNEPGSPEFWSTRNFAIIWEG